MAGSPSEYVRLIQSEIGYNDNMNHIKEVDLSDLMNFAGIGPNEGENALKSNSDFKLLELNSDILETIDSSSVKLNLDDTDENPQNYQVTQSVGIEELIKYEDSKEMIRPVKRRRNRPLKTKLYEQQEICDNEESERKRLNAIQAKYNRDKKKCELQNLKDENNRLRDRIHQLEEKLQESNKREGLLNDKLKSNENMLATIHQMVKGYGNICAK